MIARILVLWLVAWTSVAMAGPGLVYDGRFAAPSTGEGDDGDRFGQFADLGGPTLAVAAAGDVDGALGLGTTTLFRRSGGGFVREAKVAGGDFGLAVSPDGLSMVASRAVNGDGAPPYRVVLYRRRADGSGWDAVQTISSPVAGGTDGFGQSLAWDGSVLVVGAPWHSQPSANQGRAYVYSVDGNGSLVFREAILPATPSAGARFGSTVAVLGLLVAVGAPYETGAMGQGAVYVFTRHPTLLDWIQTAKIPPPQVATDQAFGFLGLALATLPPLNGNPATPTLYVSAIHQAASTGRVYRFEPGSPNWSWVDTFAPPASLGNGVRYGATLEAVGDRVAIGSLDAVTLAPRSVTLWERQGNGAFATSRLYLADATGGHFGAAAALGADGATPLLVVGAPRRNVYSRTEQGAVFVGAREASGWPAALAARLDSGESAADSRFGGEIAISGDTAAIAAYLHHVGANRAQGAVFVFTRNAAGTWVPGPRIVAPDGAAGDLFGARLAIDGDTMAIAAPNDDIGSTTDLGSVQVWVRVGGTWTLQQVLGTCFGIGSGVFLGASRVSLRGDLLLFSSPAPQGACLFRRTAGTWTLDQQLPAYSRAAILSADGARLAGLRDDGQSVDILRDDAGAWTFEAQVALDGGAAGGRELDFDGDRLVARIAVPAQSAAVVVYARNGTQWLPEATLPTDLLVNGPNSDYARVLALHGDTIVVWAGAEPPEGAFLRFVRSGGTWIATGRHALPATGGAAAYPGIGAHDGGVLVGAPFANGGLLDSNPREGAVHAYRTPPDPVFADGFEE